MLKSFANRILQLSGWNEEVAPYRSSEFARNQTAYIPWGHWHPYFNLYPAKIQELYVQSPLLRRVTKYRAAQVAGGGLVINGPRGEQAGRWLQNIGVDNEFLEACAADLALFNGCSAQILYDRQGEVRKVVQQSIAKVRIGRPDAAGHVNDYWLANDWSKVSGTGKSIFRKVSEQPIRIGAFNPHPQTISSDDYRQLCYQALADPVSDFYPIPAAESAYDELVFLNDVMGFMRSFVENGMVNSAVVYMPFTPSERAADGSLSEQDRQMMEDIETNLRETLTGKSHAGQIFVQFFDPSLAGESGNGMPKWENPIESDNDEKFLEAFREARQSAMTALGVISPDLFGIRTASGFSSQADELLTASKLSQRIDAEPLQNVILRLIDKIIRQTVNPFSRSKIELSISPFEPISQQITLDMVEKGVITRDEFREMLGFDALQTTEIE